ncbi:MAG: ATP-dependent sacrificial sulfur transferase LarE, partial [bacterium]
MEYVEKFEALKNILLNYDRLVVAFSGGVDSTFLLKVSSMVLGNNVVAVTVSGQIHPRWEIEESKALAKEIGVKQEIIDIDVLNDEMIASNPPDRCYYCKVKVFSLIKEMAKKYHIYTVADGSNADDITDYRPGIKALKELGIISPLKDARLTKLEIRMLSKELGLSTWDKPPLACLATRVPYGEKLTQEI